MVKILVIFILLMQLSSALGQTIKRYTVKDGLPSHHIYDVTQDRDGFIWFATNRGVAKFDGQSFKIFNLKNGLPNNDIYTIVADQNGRVWYNTKSKYLGYIKNDSVHRFLVGEGQVISTKFIHQTNSRLWYEHFGLKDGRIKPVINRTEYFKQCTELGDKYELGYTGFLPHEGYTIGLRNDGVILFDEVGEVIYKEAYKFPPQFFSRCHKYGLLPNDVYFFAFDTGIVLINYKTQLVKLYPYSQLSKAKAATEVQVSALENEIQVSLPQKILKIGYDLQFKERLILPDKVEGHKAFQDRKGNIWVIDFSLGVQLIPLPRQKVGFYLIGRKVDKVNFIDDDLIIGVEEDGFFKYTPTLNTFDLLVDDAQEVIYDILPLGGAAAYLVSSRKSYHLTDTSMTQMVVNVKQANGDVIRAEGFKNLMPFEGNLYATTPSGLIFNEQLARIGFNLSLQKGLHEMAVFKSTLYVGSTEGLLKLKIDTVAPCQVEDEVMEVPILELVSDEQYLMVGTNGRGVYFYDADTVIHVLATDGLMVQRIIKQDNVLWLATQAGVKVVELISEDLSCSPIINSFYTEDGLLQDNINDMAIKNDTLYVATDIGLTVLAFNDLIYKSKPSLYFDIPFDTIKRYYAKNSHLSIDYNVLDFVNQANFEFEYRLLPFQKEWVKISGRNLNFEGLTPHVYSLELKAKDQHENETIKSIIIHILPLWWQTIWARIGFTILFAFVFVSIVQILRQRDQKKQAKQLAYEKQLSSLELQALRSQMNPHFVFNSLNAIQYYFQRNEVQLSELYLVKFSKLVRLFFEYSRHQNISVDDEVELLEKYLSIEALRFEEKLSFCIKVDTHMDKDETMIPSMILQPIVENAVNHGLFHKQSKGKVEVAFEVINASTYRVVVKDDGVGINHAKTIKSQSVKNYNSRSSLVLKERIKLLNQSGDWKIDFTVEDLSETVQTSGTNVTLIFTQIIEP